MFYNALVEAFIKDESLFSDVKAIVDCPLKVDPAEVVKACRELEPKEIMELLAQPGSDLEVISHELVPPCKLGRNNFLTAFDVAPSSHGQRHHRLSSSAQLGVSSDQLLKSGPDRHLLTLRPEVVKNSNAAHLIPSAPRMTLAESKLVQMAARGRQAYASTLTTGDDALGTKRHVGRRATASALWADRVAEMMDEGGTSKGTVIPGNFVSEEAKSTAKAQYFQRLKRLGVELINMWPKFYRRVSPHWAPDRNSLIPLPRPFIVPGGRFIEIYYWDSYWILLGLLSSGMEAQAREMLENFLFCIERLGFIPNGLRKYYLDRSQPPMLSCMLRAYYHASGDLEFVRNAMQLLERDYQWWMSVKRGHCLELDMPIGGGKTKKVHLNRYYSVECTPRPESYRIDQITGQLYREFNGAAESLEEHFRAIRSAAESGWDFSSRWLRPAVEGEGVKPDLRVEKVLHKVCLVDIDTCNIIPCCLNSLLFIYEEDLAYFAALLGKKDSEQQYLAAREARREAMMHYLWDSKNEMWLDYDMKHAKLSKVVSAASFWPLWAGVNPEKMTDERRIQLASNLSCIIRPYGIVCTNVTAGLQWDCPNVWAPNHHVAVEFMCGGRYWNLHKKAADDKGPAMAIAINWASRFINTVLDRFEFFGVCSEKYDCSRLGKSGVDGEYVTQEGFGWTNGTVLDFMEKFGARLGPAGLYGSKRQGNEGLQANLI